ncbi:MAG: molybdopterin converting factor subunit 1 [Kangiellaceae bacterium]|nr:molybdopterin converting factor subunit 1 [Kangiellaceae bacterium]
MRKRAGKAETGVHKDNSITILFFAKLRDELGVAEYQMAVDDELQSISDVKERLVSQGVQWQNSLADSGVMCAVNQEMVADDAKVKSGDEVAFFPPVTGG